MEELRKLEASARQYQQEVSLSCQIKNSLHLMIKSGPVFICGTLLEISFYDRAMHLSVTDLLLFSSRANMLKLSASSRNSSKLRKSTSEQHPESSHALANSCARFATSSQSTTWRKRTLTVHLIYSRNLRSSVRITNLARQWLTTTWLAITEELARWGRL